MVSLQYWVLLGSGANNSISCKNLLKISAKYSSFLLHVMLSMVLNTEQSLRDRQTSVSLKDDKTWGEISSIQPIDYRQASNHKLQTDWRQGEMGRLQTWGPLGQINPRGTAELSFLTVTWVHPGAFEALFKAFNWTRCSSVNSYKVKGRPRTKGSWLSGHQHRLLLFKITPTGTSV